MRFLLVIFALLNFAFGCELLRLGELKDQNISGWLASEKLDGVRAYWNGRNLLSRKGKILHAPDGFTADFPPFALDGELFIGRAKFELTQSIVMDKSPDINAWRAVKFHVFDVPDAGGGLLERLANLAKFLEEKPNKNIVIVRQILVADRAELDAFLADVIERGGEGVVVREPNAPYERKRSKNALKYKKFKDAECEVVAVNRGTGKYANLMGSVTCVAIGDIDISRGVKFKIGSGFSDEIRANPPKIGEIITFKYQNLTANGVPRFPVFLRVRKD